MRALCLVGGASRGAIGCGQIAAFFDKYKDYDALFGTSVGALNGYFVHTNQLKLMYSVWRNIRSNQVYTWNPFKAFGKAASLASSKPLQRLIARYVDHTLLDANPKPFYASMTRINPFGSVTKRITGPTAPQYILASASAPIVFPTQTVEGIQYTDGGMSRNFGIEEALLKGYDELIVLWPSFIVNQDVDSLIDMLELQMTAQAGDQLQDETELVKLINRSNSQNEVSVTVYAPGKPIDLGQLDFDKAGKNFDQYFELGYNLLNKPYTQVRKVPRV